MVKEIREIGNSKGIILDAAILDAMHGDVGDKVEITIHPGGSATLLPLTPTISTQEANEAVSEILANNDELFCRLS